MYALKPGLDYPKDIIIAENLPKWLIITSFHATGWKQIMIKFMQMEWKWRSGHINDCTTNEFGM